MQDSTFVIGHAYYHCVTAVGDMAPWWTDDMGIPIVESWIYAGHLRLESNATSCDVPYHFYVFKKFIAYQNVLQGSAEYGLGFPSLYEAKNSMMTLAELIDYLEELRNR